MTQCRELGMPAIAWTMRRYLAGAATSGFIMVTAMVVLLGRTSVRLGFLTTAVTLAVRVSGYV